MAVQNVLGKMDLSMHSLKGPKSSLIETGGPGWNHLGRLDGEAQQPARLATDQTIQLQIGQSGADHVGGRIDIPD